ncbi:hypothetical protein B9Z65_3063 [Elsinoe australis]|uniref:CENP-V/GFA domain-containing protein n=1 Tax=Elsinoe australis TaxID=40998 RepID=A0A2P7ZUB1_9PEZI|nr:hypothetical protein B9Z65_3063 [Elsinoe australis]
MSKPPSPVVITGGCNCGALRYSFTLPESRELLLANNSTCQCTLCRKFTGTVVPDLILCQVSWMTSPLFHKSPEYRTYDSNVLPDVTGRRGFCSNCGSSMCYHTQSIEELTWFAIYLGTVDEEILAGKAIGEKDGKYGVRTERQGGIGHLLCDTTNSGHLFVENAVPGWDMKGRKIWRMDEEKWFSTIEEGREK